MRRTVAPLVLFALAAGADAGPRERVPEDPMDFVVETDLNDESARFGRWWPRGGPVKTLPEDVVAAARTLDEALGRVRVRLTAAAFRVRSHGGAASALLLSDAPFVDADGRRALAEAVRGDLLHPAGVAVVSGGLGEVLTGHDLGVSRVTQNRGIESAVGAVIAFPESGEVRGGLVLAVRCAPHTGGSCLVNYRCLTAASATTIPASSLNGPVDRVRAPAFAAEGALPMRDGQTALVRAVDATGRGFAIAITLDVTEPVSLPARLGGEWAAVPLGALHVGNGSPEDDPGFFPEDDLRTFPWAPERLSSRERVSTRPARPPREILEEVGVDAERVGRRGDGVVVVRARDGGVDALIDTVETALNSVHPRGIAFEHAACGHAVVPTTDGWTFRIAHGTFGTRSGDVACESGCDDCILATTYAEPERSGITATGRCRPGGSLDMAARMRTVTGTKSLAVEMRRGLPTHDGTVQDSTEFEMVADVSVSVRSVVPAGGATLPDGLVVRVTGPAGTEDPPRALAVNGHRLYVEAGGSARVAVLKKHPRLVRWESMQSCGMTLRYPLQDWIIEGLDAAVRMHAFNPVFDIAAEMGGAPETVLPHFDPGDGVVEIVRRPHLVYEAESVPWTAVRRLAWGEGLALRVGDPAETVRPPLRAVRIDADGATFGVRYPEGRELIFDGGGVTRTPAGLQTYTSNHQTADTITETVQVHDGVRLHLDDGRGVLQVDSRPTLTGHDLRKTQEPRRPDKDHALLLPDRLRRVWRLRLPTGRTLERKTAAGMPAPLAISVAPAAVEEDE